MNSGKHKKEDLIKKIKKLKEDKKVIILAHNYQREEIQEIADFVGDSLGLAIKSKNTDAEIILFAGVSFMAETAKILSPEKIVLLPRKDARCPMADMITGEDVRKLKEKYPDAAVVCYVNTTAEVKAESDVCCTSSNAVKIAKKFPADKLVFIPDRNLANYVEKFTDKEIIAWDGFCYVHRRFNKKDIEKVRKEIEDPFIMVHPECDPEVVEEADVVLSTGGMVEDVKSNRTNRKEKIIVGTEIGLIERLRREFPNFEIYSLGVPRICYNMKKITLEDIYFSLFNEQYEIKLPEEIIKKARKSIERMLTYV